MTKSQIFIGVLPAPTGHLLVPISSYLKWRINHFQINSVWSSVYRNNGTMQFETRRGRLDLSHYNNMESDPIPCCMCLLKKEVYTASWDLLLYHTEMSTCITTCHPTCCFTESLLLLFCYTLSYATSQMYFLSLVDTWSIKCILYRKKTIMGRNKTLHSENSTLRK